MKKPGVIPIFLIDSLPGVAGTIRKELLRRVEINAHAPDIFSWLKQLQVAPYSYDLLDNRGLKSPRFIIQNLPALKVNNHFLLAFHITGFKENSHIVCRFCEPVNYPVSLYIKDMFIEYRIIEHIENSELWCKITGHFNTDISSKGFYSIYSFVNNIMMTRQLKNIKQLSEKLASGKIETKNFDYRTFYATSGLHWWIFCRRNNCKGLPT